MDEGDMPGLELTVRQIDVRIISTDQEVKLARRDLFDAPDEELRVAVRRYRKAWEQAEHLRAIEDGMNKLLWSPAQGVAGRPADMVRVVVGMQESYASWESWEVAG